MHSLTWPLHEPVVIFAVVMLLLLLVPIGMQRLKLPGVVGLIFAGLLLGPNMLHLLERDSTFQLLGAVGLQYIMFEAGREIDLAGFNKVRLKAAFFGVLTFLIPISTGTFAGIYVLGFPTNSAILLGSIFASHTLLAYPVASRLGLAKHEAVTVTVGATLVTDVLALLVLAIVAKSTGGDLDAWFWSTLALGASIFLVLVMVALPRLARWFFVNRDADGVEAFLFVIAAVFASAWVAELAGLESIIGSFMAGFALNRLIPPTGPLASRLHFVGEALFIPFFLISVGMLANLWVLLDGFWSWAVSITMCVAVLSTKYAAAWLAGTVLGYSSDDRKLMFGLSVPQAAATLAAVMIGYKLDLFDDGVLNGTIIMIIVTCMVGPYVVERSGRAIARTMAEAPPGTEDAPQRILVPLANPKSATTLLDMALMVRDELSDQPIYPLAVVDESDDADARLAAAEKLLSTAVLHGAAAHVPIRPVTRIHHNVAASIVSAARDTRTSHVIAGWDGRTGGPGKVFGRVLDPVVTEASCALMVCYQRQPVSTLARVVVAIPPFAHRHPGFDELIHDVKRIAQRLAAPMLVLLAAESSESASERVKAARPYVQISTQPLAEWRGILGAIAANIKDDDLFVLFSARPGTLAWSSQLDRLPREIARRFVELDLIVAFPAEPDHLDGPDGPRAVDIGVTVDALTSEPAIRQVVDQLPDLDDAERRGLFKTLTARARSGATQLAPGILLLDTQDPAVPASRRVVVASEEGITFPGVADEVRVLVLLLSHPARPPGAHVGDLSRIAMALRHPDQIARLVAVPTIETLTRLLSPGELPQEPLPARQPDP